MPTYYDFADKNWNVIDTIEIVSGTTTYYCEAITGTAAAASDKVFKIIRKKVNAVGGNTYCHATNLDTDGTIHGGKNFNLAATDLATVAAYTYAI